MLDDQRCRRYSCGSCGHRFRIYGLDGLAVAVVQDNIYIVGISRHIGRVIREGREVVEGVIIFLKQVFDMNLHGVAAVQARDHVLAVDDGNVDIGGGKSRTGGPEHVDLGIVVYVFHKPEDADVRLVCGRGVGASYADHTARFQDDGCQRTVITSKARDKDVIEVRSDLLIVKYEAGTQRRIIEVVKDRLVMDAEGVTHTDDPVPGSLGGNVKPVVAFIQQIAAEEPGVGGLVEVEQVEARGVGFRVERRRIMVKHPRGLIVIDPAQITLVGYPEVVGQVVVVDTIVKVSYCAVGSSPGCGIGAEGNIDGCGP